MPHPNLIDLTGKKFNRLTVLKRAPNKGDSRIVYWECLCDCGKKTIVASYELRNNKTKSCGCLRKKIAHKANRRINLIDQKFGRLVVVEYAFSKYAKNFKTKHAYWKCQCICGNTIIVRAGHLKDGNIRSCGCLAFETRRTCNTTHGMSYTPEYEAWAAIKKRCYNPNHKSFKRYGGRGITMCDEWRNDFMAFFNYVGKKPSPKHTIERIDNNGNYEPGNVKWATRQEQMNNTRLNHQITIKGKTMNLIQWARLTGIHQVTIGYRLKRGWPPEKAIFEPIKHR